MKMISDISPIDKVNTLRITSVLSTKTLNISAKKEFSVENPDKSENNVKYALVYLEYFSTFFRLLIADSFSSVCKLWK